jgi:hypothetical protein
MSPGRRFLRLAARLAWWLICLGFGLATMRLTVSLAGAMATAMFLAVVLLVGGIGAWAEYVEPRVFGVPGDPLGGRVRGRRPAGHRRAGSYGVRPGAVGCGGRAARRAQCERRAGRADGDGFP